MKLQSTTPVSIPFITRASLVAISVLVLSGTIAQYGSYVLARNYDAEIDAKQKEADKYQNEASRLNGMAATLEEELNNINAQIGVIQSQIAASQKKHDDLISSIKANEELIQKNRKSMGRILSDIYTDDQVSPLELLASSGSISEYINKQEQRSSLRISLNAKIKEIKKLKKKLEEDKKAVEAVLNDQKSQRTQLASKQAQQAKLVADTRNDEAAYSQLASQRNSEIAKLRQQQAAENLRAMRRSGWSGGIPGGAAGGGGYPGVWANAPIDSLVDSWGMYNRECVSYVAYRVAANYRATGRGYDMPYWGGRGNANQWPGNAAGAGIPTGYTPKARAAAVVPGGVYGHIMYVESVNSDGTITVSDYNLAWDGLYRNYKRSAAGLVYIYFGG